jgi:transcriptional regulator with XRE-family HTH domain
METRNSILLPKAQKVISTLGENIRMARLRRKFSTQQVSERADISRPTLSAIEKGSPTVNMGAYVRVLMVLGLGDDIASVASDDELGRKLQDAKLVLRERAPKRNK